MVERALRRSVIVGAVAVGVAVSALLLVDYIHASKFGTDFGVYTRTAHGPAEDAYTRFRTYPFPYLPTMLLWVEPLSLVPRWPAYFAWVAVSVTAFVVACRRYLTWPAIALAMTSPMLLRGIFTGQVAAVLAVLLLAACASKNRVWAGIIFGVIASIKPQMVIMAPLLFVLTKDWRAAGASCATFTALCAASLAFGAERWPEWWASMERFNRALFETNAINEGISPAAVALKYGLPPLPFLLVGSVIGACVVYRCRRAEPLETAAAVAVGSFLAAPYALSYDLTAALPFLAWSVAQGRLVPLLAIMGAAHPVPIGAATLALLSGKGTHLRTAFRLPFVKDIRTA